MTIVHRRGACVLALRFGIACVVLAIAAGPASAGLIFGDGPNLDLAEVNRSLKGRVDDYTHNHGKDRRFCSAALGSKRDVYVYVPPGYDPEKRYPIVYWLHGFAQDEKVFLEIVGAFDKAMLDGWLPKAIIVAPDGSPKGRASFFDPGTFYINSDLGNYGDFIVTDVWNFVVERYSIRPEREAHVLAGASMGGFGAYNLGIKHREQFGDSKLGNHTAILVDLDKTYLADLGLGDGIRDPVPLSEGTYRQGRLTFSLEKTTDNYWRFHNHEFAFPANFDFRDAPLDEVLIDRFSAAYQSGEDPLYHKNLAIQIMRPESVICLSGRVLRHKTPDGTSKRLIMRQEFEEVLGEVFGIVDKDALLVWPRVEARHRELFGDKPITEVNVTGF